MIKRMGHIQKGISSNAPVKYKSKTTAIRCTDSLILLDNVLTSSIKLMVQIAKSPRPKVQYSCIASLKLKRQKSIKAMEI
jgi:hypothetical protein